MAEYCRQCSELLFGPEIQDYPKAAPNTQLLILCEGCGDWVAVDESGYRVSTAPPPGACDTEVQVDDIPPADHETYWWVEMANGESGSLALAPGETLDSVFKRLDAPVVSLSRLPYAAIKCLYRHPDVQCPDLCYKPETCAGRTACPRNPACSE